MTLDAVDLSLSDLSNANLEDALLRNALLSGTILKESKLYGANLRDADLSLTLTLNKSCRDSLAKLSVNLRGADRNLSLGSIDNLSFNSIPESCIIRRTKLIDANLRKANLNGANLSGANLRGSDLRDVGLETVESLEGAIYDEKTKLTKGQDRVLKKAKAYMIKKGTQFPGKNLSGANLSDTNLSGADLSNTNLSNTNLSSANLSSANLSDTNLSGANLCNTNLSNTNLSGAKLCNTTWIDGKIKNSQEKCNGREILYSLPKASATDESTETTATLRDSTIFSIRF